MSLSQPAAFFDVLRASILGPTLSQSEVEGCNAIMAACARWPLGWVAYGLATSFHESAHTMQPIKEYGGDAYFRRMYDIEGLRPDKARELGNVEPGDGPAFAGRGYCQLTGRANYAKASNIVGLDLVSDPDLAMRPDVAAKILERGMRTGWFTGKKLGDYLPAAGSGTREQFVRSRRIINGSDRAAMIADFAEAFQDALTLGGWTPIGASS